VFAFPAGLYDYRAAAVLAMVLVPAVLMVTPFASEASRRSTCRAAGPIPF
jgi:hypothetical protein